MDTNGLSAYLQWLREDVLGPERFKTELADNFPRKQLDRLHRAVDDADATLEAAWLRPGSALRVTRKRKAELDALLAEIITSESASEDLYRRCFPDKVLVADYKKRLLAEVEAAAATEAERGGGGAQGGAGQGLSRDSCAAQLFDA